MTERRNAYEYEDLLACARGELFGPGNAQLALPPMLMFDRITEITETGGETARAASSPNSTSSRTCGSFPAISRAIRSCRAASASMRCGRCRLLPRLARRTGQGPGARRRRGKFTGMVMPTVKKLRIWRRPQARHPPQTRSRHRRWLAEGGRRDHLYGQGPESRPVPRARAGGRGYGSPGL